MDWRKVVGENARRLRLAKGLSQEEVAHAAGIDVTYLSGIERAKFNPSLSVLTGLADALSCDPRELLAH